MNMLRSPKNNEPRCSSQPDLSKLETAVSPLSSITTRKRKQPDHCDCKHDIKELRTEMSRMTSLLEKLVTSQEQTLNTMQDSISKMSSEIKDIKASTSSLVREQNTVKNNIAELNIKLSTHEEKINTLESGIGALKNPLSSEQHRPLTSEDTIRELHERFNRSKNVIIAGLSEQHSSDADESFSKDEREVTAILSTIVPDCPKPIKIARIGKYVPEKCRMIKVCFGSQEIAMTLLRNKSKCSKKVKIFSDQTPSQQRFLNDLKVELTRRMDNGEQDLKIKYLKGIPTIVKDASKNYPQKN